VLNTTSITNVVIPFVISLVLNIFIKMYKNFLISGVYAFSYLDRILIFDSSLTVGQTEIKIA